MFIPEWQRIVFLCLARPADLAPSPPKSVSIELPSVPNTYQIRKQCQNPSPAYLKIITQKLPDIPIPPPPFFLKNKKKTKETLCSSGWDFPFLRKIERNPSVISRIQLFLNDYHLQRYLFIIKWTGTISWDSSVVFPFLWFFLWYASPPPSCEFFFTRNVLRAPCPSTMFWVILSNFYLFVVSKDTNWHLFCVDRSLESLRYVWLMSTFRLYEQMCF